MNKSTIIAQAISKLEATKKPGEAPAVTTDRSKLEARVWSVIPADLKTTVQGKKSILVTEVEKPFIAELSKAPLETLTALLKAYDPIEIESSRKANLTLLTASLSVEGQGFVSLRSQDPLDGDTIAFGADGRAIMWKSAPQGFVPPRAEDLPKTQVVDLDIKPGVLGYLDADDIGFVAQNMKVGVPELKKIDEGKDIKALANLYLNVINLIGWKSIPYSNERKINFHDLKASVESLGVKVPEITAAEKLKHEEPKSGDKPGDPYEALSDDKKMPAVIVEVDLTKDTIYKPKSISWADIKKNEGKWSLALWCIDMDDAKEKASELERRRGDKRPLPDTWPVPEPQRDGLGIEEVKNPDGPGKVTKVKKDDGSYSPYALEKPEEVPSLAERTDKLRRANVIANPSIKAKDSNHSLVIESTDNAKASCSAGDWHYSFPGHREKTEIEEEFAKHKDQFTAGVKADAGQTPITVSFKHFGNTKGVADDVIQIHVKPAEAVAALAPAMADAGFASIEGDTFDKPGVDLAPAIAAFKEAAGKHGISIVEDGGEVLVVETKTPVTAAPKKDKKPPKKEKKPAAKPKADEPKAEEPKTKKPEVATETKPSHPAPGMGEVDESRTGQEEPTEEEVKRLMATALGCEPDELEVKPTSHFPFNEYGGYEVTRGDEEYYAFDESDEEDLAKSMVKNDLETEGHALFNQDFLMGHVDRDGLRDFMDTVFREFADQDAEEEKIPDNEREAWEDNYVNERMGNDDGESWWRDNVGDEDFIRIIKDNNLIDEDSLVDEAVSTDGAGHFLSPYDGEINYIERPGREQLAYVRWN